MLKFILILIGLIVLGTYSFYNLIAGSVYLTAAIFTLSFTGVVIMVMYLIGEVVFKIISLWEEENENQ